MTELSEQAKKYIFAVMEYAEWFDGTQGAISQAFDCPFGTIENDEQMAKYDEWYAANIAPAQEEVRRWLNDE